MAGPKGEGPGCKFEVDWTCGDAKLDAGSTLYGYTAQADARSATGIDGPTLGLRIGLGWGGGAPREAGASSSALAAGSIPAMLSE